MNVVEETPIEATILHTCAIIGITIGLVNSVLCTCVLVLELNDVKKYHLNFVVLRFNFLLACFFLCVTRVVLCVAQLLLESQYGENAQFLRIVSAIRAMEGSGVNMLRLSFIALCLERFAATLFSSTYESTASFRLLGPLLAVFTDIIAISMSICYNILGVPFNVYLFVVLAFDITGLIAVVFLERFNRKLRRIDINSEPQLSKRYQLMENLRVIRILRPLILTGVVVAIFCITCSVVIRYVIGSTVLTRPTYFTIVNLYVTLACAITIWYYFKRPTNGSASADRPGCYRVLRPNSRVDRCQSEQTAPVIRNGLGEEIGQCANFDNHFSSLSKQWS
ncbi:hypothetical protein AAVH_12808 [Aphelenchoides avenae]|nr:hypothetical protein AAVH_12808 [Aphelenchus avenae]